MPTTKEGTSSAARQTGDGILSRVWCEEHSETVSGAWAVPKSYSCWGYEYRFKAAAAPLSSGNQIPPHKLSKLQ